MAGDLQAQTTVDERERLTEKLQRVVGEELGPFHLRATLARVLAAPLPRYVGGRLRAALLRLIGVRVGRGTVVCELPAMHGAGDIYSRLAIGPAVMINIGCFFDLNGAITIGAGASLGHEVKLLTMSHTIGPPEHRAGDLIAQPIVIGAGVWLGARSMVLPGVTVGAGSIVAAGAVVTRDVPPNSLVAGVPARVVRQLDQADVPV